VSHRDHAVEAGAVRTGLAVTAALCVAELVGGWLTNSLALLSDAMHMFTDVGALGLTWFALWIADRPASSQKTYGYYRAEILAAFVNGVVLCVLVGIVLIEAWRRLHEPPEVAGAGMLVIATLGLAVNVFVARRLHAHQHASLNMRGAYLHVVSDLLGSVGAIVACARHSRDRLDDGRRAREHRHRDPHPARRVDARRRGDRRADGRRAGARRARRSYKPRSKGSTASPRSTICTCGR
jgi:Co/Zn/Cd efflux system component